MLKKNNNSGTSAFIAGESLSSNFLWIIPMIDGISKSRNVKNLIFENKFENFLLKNPSTKLKIPFGYLPVNKITIKEKTVQITTPIKIKIRAMM